MEVISENDKNQNIVNFKNKLNRKSGKARK